MIELAAGLDGGRRVAARHETIAEDQRTVMTKASPEVAASLAANLPIKNQTMITTEVDRRVTSREVIPLRLKGTAMTTRMTLQSRTMIDASRFVVWLNRKHWCINSFVMHHELGHLLF